VTHIEDPAEVIRLANRVPCHAIQLHSDLSFVQLAALRKQLRPRKVIGKVSVQDESAIDRAKSIQGSVDAVLLDSIDPLLGKVGGTGLVHDWKVSATIAASLSVPIILAGGLTPLNVRQAIAAVRPWAVDVNSGVEGRSGQKSEDRVRKFLRAVAAAG